MTYSWEQIIDGCMSGEHQFQMLAYNQCWKMVFPNVMRIIQNREEAEDVMQDSMIKGFESLHQLNDKESYIFWQKSISVRAAYNYIRDRKRHGLEFPLDVRLEVDNNQGMEEPVPSELIEKALGLLASGYQMVIRMHLLDNLKHEEIAEILGISPSTARSQYSRAIQRLKLNINGQN